MCGSSWLAVCLDCEGVVWLLCVIHTFFYVCLSPCAAVRPEKEDREFN